jgi:glucose/mannose-6-phosphate isomerase
MVNLDSPETYQRLDPSNMKGRLIGLPQQCEEAWGAAFKLRLPPSYRKVGRVLVAGMGGSATGASIARYTLARLWTTLLGGQRHPGGGLQLLRRD